MTPFAWGVALLVVCVVGLAVERGVRFVRWVRELVEASAWGWEL